jgi:hypothetical protein
MYSLTRKIFEILGRKISTVSSKSFTSKKLTFLGGARLGDTRLGDTRLEGVFTRVFPILPVLNTQRFVLGFNILSSLHFLILGDLGGDLDCDLECDLGGDLEGDFLSNCLPIFPVLETQRLVLGLIILLSIHFFILIMTIFLK